MADAVTPANSGGWSWQNMISDALNAYTTVEVAKGQRGVYGAYEDLQAGLNNPYRYSNPQAYANSYGMPTSNNSTLLWIAVGVGAGLLLMLALQKG